MRGRICQLTKSINYTAIVACGEWLLTVRFHLPWELVNSILSTVTIEFTCVGTRSTHSTILTLVSKLIYFSCESVWICVHSSLPEVLTVRSIKHFSVLKEFKTVRFIHFLYCDACDATRVLLFTLENVRVSIVSPLHAMTRASFFQVFMNIEKHRFEQRSKDWETNDLVFHSTYHPAHLNTSASRSIKCIAWCAFESVTDACSLIEHCKFTTSIKNRKFNSFIPRWHDRLIIIHTSLICSYVPISRAVPFSGDREWVNSSATLRIQCYACDFSKHHFVKTMNVMSLVQ